MTDLTLDQNIWTVKKDDDDEDNDDDDDDDDDDFVVFVVVVDVIINIERLSYRKFLFRLQYKIQHNTCATKTNTDSDSQD